MAGAAELGTLPAKDALGLRMQAQDRLAAGEHVHLAAKRRDPERVDYPVRGQAKLGPRPHRQPDLVGRHDGVCRAFRPVLHPPPPLLARDAHHQPVAGAAVIGQCRKRPDQQGGQDDGRQDNAAPDQQAARVTFVEAARRDTRHHVEGAVHHQPQDDCPSQHDPEYLGDGRRVLPGGIQGRLFTSAASQGQQQSRSGKAGTAASPLTLELDHGTVRWSGATWFHAKNGDPKVC